MAVTAESARWKSQARDSRGWLGRDNLFHFSRWRNLMRSFLADFPQHFNLISKFKQSWCAKLKGVLSVDVCSSLTCVISIKEFRSSLAWIGKFYFLCPQFFSSRPLLLLRKMFSLSAKVSLSFASHSLRPLAHNIDRRLFSLILINPEILSRFHIERWKSSSLLWARRQQRLVNHSIRMFSLFISKQIAAFFIAHLEKKTTSGDFTRNWKLRNFLLLDISRSGA